MNMDQHVIDQLGLYKYQHVLEWKLHTHIMKTAHDGLGKSVMTTAVVLRQVENIVVQKWKYGSEKKCCIQWNPA